MAEAEGRSAGNALGQGYCMLTVRAATKFHHRVMNSKYRLDIKLINTIHDAVYVIFRDDEDIAEWVNTNIVECVEWQDLPELQHDAVKLSGKFGIFYPDWSNELTLPVGATASEIADICASYKP